MLMSTMWGNNLCCVHKAILLENETKLNNSKSKSSLRDGILLMIFFSLFSLLKWYDWSFYSLLETCWLLSFEQLPCFDVLFNLPSLNFYYYTLGLILLYFSLYHLLDCPFSKKVSLWHDVSCASFLAWDRCFNYKCPPLASSDRCVHRNHEAGDCHWGLFTFVPIWCVVPDVGTIWGPRAFQ